MDEQEIMATVDEFVNQLDETEIEQQAQRLGISVDDLLQRIVTETKARLA